MKSTCYLGDPLLEKAMGLALEEAGKAALKGDIPVGAVLLWEDEVVAADHNRREADNDPLAHAEMLVIAEASKALGRWRLDKARLVVTLEPCPMCMGAILQARIPFLAYGADDPKAGFAGTLYDLSADPRMNHRVDVLRGLRRQEASELLSRFFEGLRQGRG